MQPMADIQIKMNDYDTLLYFSMMCKGNKKCCIWVSWKHSSLNQYDNLAFKTGFAVSKGCYKGYRFHTSTPVL